MPYLQFDLDAMRKVDMAAQAVGVHPGFVAWGLLRLWEHVWRTKTDTVAIFDLDGCFSGNEKLRPLLAHYGFIEPLPDGQSFRVRGAKERLFGAVESGAKGGKKTASSGKSLSNLKQFSVPKAAEGSTEGSPKAPSDKPPIPSEGSPKLTQHPASSIQKDSPFPGAPLIECLQEVFRQERNGAHYEPSLDDTNIALRAINQKNTGGDAEIIRRYRMALRNRGYPKVATLTELARFWDHFAAPEPVPIHGKPKPEPKPKDPNRPTGVVANEF